jgi:hypothetical protein
MEAKVFFGSLRDRRDNRPLGSAILEGTIADLAQTQTSRMSRCAGVLFVRRLLESRRSGLKIAPSRERSGAESPVIAPVSRQCFAFADFESDPASRLHKGRSPDRESP